MSAVVAPTRQALDAVAAAAGRLGIDVGGEVGALRQFLDGPPSVLVAGVANPDRAAVAAAVAGAADGCTVREAEPAAGVADELWDVLIVTTPAERALSRAEEALVRAAAERRQPVLVVVTRIGLLGADRAAAVRELERFRLRPALGVLDVRWYFDGGQPADRVPLLADLTEQLRRTQGHQRAGEPALRRLLDGAIGRFGELLAGRARDLATLAELETVLPAQLTSVYEQANTTRLALADGLDAARDAVYDAAFETARAADEWILTDGVGPWSDVERPVRQAWQALRQYAESALDRAAAQQRDALRHIAAGVAAGLARLDVAPPPQPVEAGASWRTPAVDEALDLLAGVDLEPPLRRLAEEAGRRAAELWPAEPAEPPDGGGSADETGALRRTVDAGRRVIDAVQQRVAGPPGDALGTRLHHDLRVVLAGRLAAARDALVAAAEAGAGTEAQRAAHGIRALLAHAAGAIDERYRWYGAYSDLLALRARG